MKKLFLNYSFAILSLMGVGLLSSCTEDEGTPGPSISLVNPPAEEQNSGATIEFTVKAEAPERIQSITILEKIGSNSKTVSGYPKTSGFSNNTDDLFIFTYEVPATEETVELTFRVTDKNGKESSKSHTITVKKGTSTGNLDAAKAFEWKRVGSADGTGLSEFGLAWTQNTATSAIIKKGADKLVVLTSADWTNITTKEALKAKVDGASDVADFRTISATEASKTYNEVIATKKGDDYYLINVTKSTVATGASTTITITGNCKK